MDFINREELQKEWRRMLLFVLGYYGTIRIAPLSTLASRLDCSARRLSLWLNIQTEIPSFYYQRKLEKLYNRLKDEVFDETKRMTKHDDCVNQVYLFIKENGSVNKSELGSGLENLGFSRNAIKKALAELRLESKRVIFIRRKNNWEYQLADHLPEVLVEKYLEER